MYFTMTMIFMVSAEINILKSFCLRDRGRLGNEGRPISLKIGTQSRYVDLCNMPKFQVQRPSSSRVLDISPSGVPRGRFLVSFWPLFNLSFSIWEATGNGLFFRPHIFHAHVLYREVLVSLQSSALSLVIPRKKY